jgi:Spy/CpxP family protein refolding chaperone
VRRSALLLVTCLILASPAGAQDSLAAATVPAAIALNLRQKLALTDSQVAKLREIERQQSAAFERTVAAFLRAEADVITAAQGDDPVVRRSALEKRAKVAIDADVARMKWDKDVRAVLTERQALSLSDWAGAAVARGATPVLWQPLIAPVDLRAAVGQLVDSGEVRVSVSPNYADIYLNGDKRGTGRKVFLLPVGKYELKFHATGCTEVAQSIEIVKGPPIVISKSLTCSR